MNERIKELALQAGFDQHHAEYDTCIKQFAELIVKECADVIDQVQTEGGDFVRRHFGVEE
jgi:hypothetical protein